MESELVRRVFTSRGTLAFCTWSEAIYQYSVLMLNLGNNFNSKLEIVSALNTFNIGNRSFHYNFINSAVKYNPKVYFGAIQTASEYWNFDRQSAENWASNGDEKSGSWP